MSFEQFLRNRHADQYSGLDDDMTDAFDHWLEDLDIDEIIQYADKFGELEFLDGQKVGLNQAIEIIKK